MIVLSVLSPILSLRIHVEYCQQQMSSTFWMSSTFTLFSCQHFFSPTRWARARSNVSILITITSNLLLIKRCQLLMCLGRKVFNRPTLETFNRKLGHVLSAKQPFCFTFTSFNGENDFNQFVDKKIPVNSMERLKTSNWASHSWTARMSISIDVLRLWKLWFMGRLSGWLTNGFKLSKDGLATLATSKRLCFSTVEINCCLLILVAGIILKWCLKCGRRGWGKKMVRKIVCLNLSGNTSNRPRLKNCAIIRETPLFASRFNLYLRFNESQVTTV